MNSQSKGTWKIFFGVGVIVFIVILMGIYFTKDFGKTNRGNATEDAISKMNKLIDEIAVNEIPPKKGQVDLSPVDVGLSLPDVSKYPLTVNNTTPTFIEIASSIEKTGKDKDGWLNDVAREFNNSNIKVNGKSVSVRIRGIASGMATDYIVSRKYVPDAFTPFHALWGEVLTSKGVKTTLIDNRLAGNVAGICVSKKKYKDMQKKYGTINTKTVIDEVSKNQFTMGYTNPLVSSSGLNFLVSVFSSFDNQDLVSEKAIKGFEDFQGNIQFVSYTSLQMREAVASGVFDGFAMENRVYVTSPDMVQNYTFTPIGVRHDSPLYGIGDLSDEKAEIIKKFADFCKSDRMQKIASDYGFNLLNNYNQQSSNIKGNTIMQIQKLWKEKKNSKQDIAAVFVADVSGSMQGKKLSRLKESLINGSKYISNNNSIGLVTFSNDVNINLPIGKFDLNQRTLFAGAINEIRSEGGTAMYDGILVALRMLLQEKEKNPNSKLMMFVLTDGETNKGSKFDDVKDIIETLKVPVSTIGYDADIKTLKNISLLNEAPSINADSNDVVYELGSLFNAEM